MKDFSLQTGAKLSNLGSLCPASEEEILTGDYARIFVFRVATGWQKEMSKLAYWKQEKKIQIFTEVKMNDFFDSSKMGDRKDS